MNYYLRFTLAYVFAGLFAGTAFAGSGQGIATQYEITMLKFELCTDAPLTTEEDVTCTGAVVVGTGSKIFDIASVSPGASIGSFVSTTGLPIGVTYKYAKPTFSKKITVTGSVSLTSPTCNCRTDTLSTFNPTKGKYKSSINGVCDSAAAEPQVIYMQDLVTDNSNVTCLNTTCSGAGGTTPTNYSRTSLASLNYMFGKSMENTAVGSTSMSAIYILENPYTVTAVAPKIELAFGTQKALHGDSFTNVGAQCVVDMYYPKVRIKITN